MTHVIEIVASHMIVETMVYSFSRISRQAFVGRRVSLDDGATWITKGHLRVYADRLQTYRSVVREVGTTEYARRAADECLTLELVARKEVA
jgi:hypothetical protein